MSEKDHPAALPKHPLVDRLHGEMLWRKWKLAHFAHEGWAQAIAGRLPERVAYFAFVRVMTHAWSDAKHKAPNDITYQEACDAWTRRRRPFTETD